MGKEEIDGRKTRRSAFRQGGKALASRTSRNAPWQSTPMETPPAYAPGIGYVDDPKLGDQSQDFMELARCIDGAYNRHGDMGQTGQWANTILSQVEARTSYERLSTQDLLDVVFLACRGERFCDGLIRQHEPLLRAIIQEVVRRIRSDAPPMFIVQKSATTENR